MAALTVQEISSDAACYSYFHRGDFERAAIYLLNQINVNSGGASMTPAQISSAAACYGYFHAGDFERAAIYLLNQILAGGGGGGGNTNPVYTGAAPPAAPAFPLQGAIFTPDADGVPLQKWIPGTGWVVI